MYDYSDNDTDTDNSSITWLVNGNVVYQGNPLNSALSQGDSLTCQVTANDGLEDGNLLSATTTVANAPPILESVSISPSTPVYGDTLLCNLGTITDSDGDVSFSYAYEWLVNGNVVSTTETLRASHRSSGKS